MTYLICLIFGILTALPLIFGKLAFISWVCIAPLFYIAGKCKKPYLHGFCFSFGYYFAAYMWFVSMYPMDYVGFTTLQSIGTLLLALIGIPLYQGAELALVPLFYSKIGRSQNKYLSAVSASCMWVLVEWFQTKFWFGVPYARLALTQARFTPAIQSASLFGSLFVSFLIVLSNALLSIFISDILEKSKNPESSDNPNNPKKKNGYLSAILAIAIFASNSIFGAVSLTLSKNTGENTVRVACIQGNIGSKDKSADDSAEHSLEVYKTLTEKAAENDSPDIIIWPETAVPTAVLQNDRISEFISGLAKKTGAIILTGAFNETVQNDGTAQTTNSIIAFFPSGEISDTVYSKRNLVPFGEYIPMERLLKALIPSLSDVKMFKDKLTPGDSPSIFKTELGSIGGLICFDSIYDSLSLESVQAGAELIVISTNDSWANGSSELYQHESHAILRAVETGRYIARAANTGNSSIIDSHGRITASFEPMTEGYAIGNAEFLTYRTVYSVIGDSFVLFCLCFVIAVSSAAVIKKIKKRSKSA